MPPRSLPIVLVCLSVMPSVACDDRGAQPATPAAAPTDQTPAPAPPDADVDSKTTPTQPDPERVVVFDLPLGASMAEAIAAAPNSLTMTPDGDDYTTVTGSLEGREIREGSIAAIDGRLAHVSLQFDEPDPDPSLAASPLLARLVATIGAPHETNVSLARWKTDDYVVELQMVSGIARDATEHHVGYSFSARLLSRADPQGS